MNARHDNSQAALENIRTSPPILGGCLFLISQLLISGVKLFMDDNSGESFTR